MKQKSYTSAILKLVILSSIALSSSWYGYDYYSRYESAFEEQQSAEQKLAEEQASLEKLQKILTPEGGELKATVRLESFMDRAWESASRHDVQIKMTLIPAGSSGGKVSGGLVGYLEPVPKTKLKSALIEISGQYATYTDFQNLMAELQGAGGFIANMSVKGTSFKLAYRVYGQ